MTLKKLAAAILASTTNAPTAPNDTIAYYP